MTEAEAERFTKLIEFSRDRMKEYEQRIEKYIQILDSILILLIEENYQSQNRDCYERIAKIILEAREN